MVVVYITLISLWIQISFNAFIGGLMCFASKMVKNLKISVFSSESEDAENC